MASHVSKPELIVADRLLSLLETAELPPWRKPWKGGGVPRNGVSGRPYTGLNRWLLMLAPYADAAFVTFNQAQSLGGSVKKGEKGWPVVFWKFPTAEEVAAGKRPFCRYYTVFNVEQCEGLDLSKIKGLETIEETAHEPIEACESIWNNYRSGPSLENNEQRAYYSPNFDKINMPRKETFGKVEDYYSTLFHEMTHSTGHTSRLNRDAIQSISYGSHEYSEEELVAEFGAAELCGMAGIEPLTLENSAAYIASWHKKLKKEPEALIRAIKAASKGVKLILGNGEEAEDADG